MSNISFDFQEKKYHIFAYVEQTCSVANEDDRLYTTVVLRFEGLTGCEVFSGTAIAVPQDWNMKFNNKASKIKVIKTGVQLALQRAIDSYWYHDLKSSFGWGSSSWEDRIGWLFNVRRKEISAAFWDAFLPHIDEV